jgi:hypothetical protein
MNYFTRELIARGQTEDDKVVSEVEALWDQACDQYFAYLDSIKGDMPPGLRHRVDGYYLHDATIRGIGPQGNAFVIMLQLDTPPHSLITFTYDLLSELVIHKETLPPEAHTIDERVEWQYDEIERVPGNPPTWRQAILLSNGWEVKLDFRDLQVQEAQALPAPRNGASMSSPASLSETAAS